MVWKCIIIFQQIVIKHLLSIMKNWDCNYRLSTALFTSSPTSLTSVSSTSWLNLMLAKQECYAHQSLRWMKTMDCWWRCGMWPMYILMYVSWSAFFIAFFLNLKLNVNPRNRDTKCYYRNAPTTLSFEFPLDQCLIKDNESTKLVINPQDLSKILWTLNEKLNRNRNPDEPRIQLKITGSKFITFDHEQQLIVIRLLCHYPHCCYGGILSSEKAPYRNWKYQLKSESMCSHMTKTDDELDLEEILEYQSRFRPNQVNHYIFYPCTLID